MHSPINPRSRVPIGHVGHTLISSVDHAVKATVLCVSACCTSTYKLCPRHKSHCGERLLTPKEVSTILQVTQETLARWRQLEDGPKFVKFGRGRTAPIRYQVSDVIAFVEQSLRESTTGPGAA
jgi:hypothetical protein